MRIVVENWYDIPGLTYNFGSAANVLPFSSFFPIHICIGYRTLYTKTTNKRPNNCAMLTTHSNQVIGQTGTKQSNYWSNRQV
jgi:hypothetical protein